MMLNGGTVSTLRWIDIAEGERIRGQGKIVGDVSNKGTISIEGKGLEIDGEVILGGTLSMKTKVDGITPGKPMTILKAKSIKGSFENTDLEIRGENNFEMIVGYTGTSVTLTAKKN